MEPELRRILDRVVAQFSDPYAFLRELVQNSLDAGSNLVDIDIEYAQGCSVLTCTDTGEGMDEHLIDTRLTRVFASSKQEDLTKIGRFGIGFLSIFALQPRDVVVDTGRNGQAFRVHFHADRSFTKTRLAQPVEGTQIRWVKPQPPGQHAEFHRRCVNALWNWCRFVPAQLRCNGQAVHEEFAFEDDLAIVHRESGSEIALRPCHPEPGDSSFYNQGLTLAENQPALHSGIEVRVSSRFLEHTLTRDNLSRDVGFEKAVALVERALRQRLIPHLLARAASGFRGKLLRRLAGVLPWLEPEHWHQPLWPDWDATLLSLQQIRSGDWSLALPEGDPLGPKLVQRGVRVLRLPEGSELLLEALELNPKSARRVFVDCDPIQPDAREQVWLSRLAWMLQRDSCTLVDFRGLGSHLEDCAYLTSDDRQPPFRVDDHDEGEVMLVNRSYPPLANLLRLSPEWGPAPLCTLLPQCFTIPGDTEGLLDRAMRDCPF